MVVNAQRVANSDVLVWTTPAGAAAVYMLDWQRDPGDPGFHLFPLSIAREVVSDPERGRLRNATMSTVMVPGSFVSVTVTNVPFVGGRRYFIGLRAFNTNMLQSPPPVPSQFNIGYTPSNFFDAAPGSAAVAVPSLVQEAPAKDNPVGR